MPPETKPWYQSATMVVNLLTLLAVALMLPEVKEIIPASAARYITAGVAIINLALRLFKDQSSTITMTNENKKLLVVLALVPGLATLSGCGGKPVQLVARSGVVLVQSVREGQRLTARLVDADVISPQRARTVQVALLHALDTLQPLPDVLEQLDRAAQAGTTKVEQLQIALDLLQKAGLDLDQALGGLPQGEAATTLIRAAREAQKLVDQITTAIAKLKASARVRHDRQIEPILIHFGFRPAGVEGGIDAI